MPSIQFVYSVKEAKESHQYSFIPEEFMLFPKIFKDTRMSACDLGLWNMEHKHEENHSDPS
jgi:hypothetical protein